MHFKIKLKPDNENCTDEMYMTQTVRMMSENENTMQAKAIKRESIRMKSIRMKIIRLEVY